MERIEELFRTHHTLFPFERQRELFRPQAAVKAEINLPASRIQDWHQDRGGGMRLYGNRFQSADRGDGPSVHFRPPFCGREPHAQPGERSGACCDCEQIKLFECKRRLPQEKFEVAKHARGISFLAPCGDYPDDFFIAENRQTACRRGSIEREDEHGWDYRAISGPIPEETCASADGQSFDKDGNSLTPACSCA